MTDSIELVVQTIRRISASNSRNGTNSAQAFSQWTLRPFLVAASSGLGEEALAGESSEAAAG
ncbi:hypothetical protein ACFYN3_42125, partial [Streptomyces lavendulae]|uniref:hypothetical protein n=1 Tax=Streptomyces lavendulae TaxID=1914 RepID=UPI00369FC2B1